MIYWIFNSISWNSFDICSFIWGITFNNLKYLVKPIKCLEMRAKIKSVRKINKIILCIFTYISNSDISTTDLNFDKKCVLVILKAKYQNDPNKVKKSHMFQVTGIILARGINKYFLTGLKEHTVFYWLQLDTDGDGQLTFDEFKVLFANADKRKKDTERKQSIAREQPDNVLTKQVHFLGNITPSQ